MATNTKTSTRDSIRAATLGAKTVFRSEIVEVKGVKVEVRQPSIRQRATLRGKATDAKGTLDFFEFLVWGVIHCTFVPGTDENIFEPSDYNALVDGPAGSFVDALSETLSKLLNVESEEVKKP